MRHDEISSLVQLSKEFVKAKIGREFKGFTNEEFFEVNKNKFAAYQFLDEKMRSIRVIILKSGKLYYQLSAIQVKSKNPSELFNIQNSLLISIKY